MQMNNEKEVILRVENAQRYYKKNTAHIKPDGTREKTTTVKSVDGVSFELKKGEILGVIGESGCGKSTLGRLLVRLEPVTGGQIVLDGQNVEEYIKKDRISFRSKTQMVFQNPFDTFDPRHTVGKILVDTMKLHNIGSGDDERREMAVAALTDAGLKPAEDFMARFPHELSGGQLQRISILRSMLLKPLILVADEPVSMLDVSIRADIINMIYSTARKEDTAAVFISHDIVTTRYISDRIAVMYLGRIVEIGDADEVALNPQHPYTKALISNCSSIDPTAKREAIHLPGEPPTPVDIPFGCPFHPRCPFATEGCDCTEQELKDIGGGHFVRCDKVTCR